MPSCKKILVLENRNINGFDESTASECSEKEMDIYDEINSSNTLYNEEPMDYAKHTADYVTVPP